MKTAIIFRVNLFSISMLLFSSSFAQKGFNSQSAYSTSSYHKQHTEFSPAIAKNSGNESVAVTEKTMKHFNKKFHNTAHVIWEQLDDNFLATFVKNDVTTKSLFDKKGRLIYAIDFSAGKELPNDVKNLVRNNYENYTITSVTKVEKDGRKIWVVNLSGTKNYIAVKVEDGEIEETENFKRAN